MNEKLKRIYELALKLASEDKKNEPNIQSVYWFPNENEVRLLALEDDFIASGSGYVEPYYFSTDAKFGQIAPSGLALIRTDEFQKLKLPERWGSWDKAKKLDIK